MKQKIVISTAGNKINFFCGLDIRQNSKAMKIEPKTANTKNFF